MYASRLGAQGRDLLLVTYRKFRALTNEKSTTAGDSAPALLAEILCTGAFHSNWTMKSHRCVDITEILLGRPLCADRCAERRRRHWRIRGCWRPDCGTAKLR